MPAGAPARNSVQTIIDDMALPNDARLLGIPDYGWASAPVPAVLAMATDSRGCNAPAWWRQSDALAVHKSCDFWRAFVQWFVIFEGEGNRADNVRVQVRHPRSWYLSRARDTWRVISGEHRMTWFLATKRDITWVKGDVDIDDATAPPSSAAPRSLAIRVRRGAPHTYHGIVGEGPISIADSVEDFAAVFATVEARLVIADPDRPDDRDQAVWLFQSGADFYPTPTTHYRDAMPPGVGLSRSKRLTSSWQSFNFATLNVARQDYPGPSRAISVDTLRSNPPPLDTGVAR